MDEKQAVTFVLFFSTFLNPQRATLTYSALEEEEELCLKSMHFSSNPGGYEFFHTLL